MGYDGDSADGVCRRSAAQAPLCFIWSGGAGSVDCFGECGRALSGTGFIADERVCHSYGAGRECVAAGAADVDRDAAACRIGNRDWDCPGTCFWQDAAVDGAAESCGRLYGRDVVRRACLHGGSRATDLVDCRHWSVGENGAYTETAGVA